MLTKEQYIKFCNNAENLQIYDGRGKTDQYECEGCGNLIFTIYGDKGVTPFVIRCPQCGNSMCHNKTLDKAPEGTDVIRWVRPSYRYYRRSESGTQKHIEQGGLVMEVKQHINK